ncbi:MAG: hypothetical protein RLZZ464_1871, partial [Pseudomonadota bacterium]
LNQIGTFAQTSVGTTLTVTPGNTLSGTASSNYTVIQPTNPMSAAITQRSLTVTGNAVSKTYDKSAYSLGAGSVSYSGFASGEGTANLGGGLSFTGAGTTAVNAGGPYAFIPAGLTSSNYNISYLPGSVTINRANLTVGGLTVSGKTYDGTTTASVNTSGATYTGLLAGDSVTVNITGADFASKNAGTHTVSLTSINGGADAGNYTITASNSLTGTISPAPLTVSAQVKTMTYGANALPNLTYTTTGLVSGDSLSGALATTASPFNGSAGSASGVGTYPISQGTLSAGSNYTLTSFTGGNLTVQPATLTYVAGTATSVYGQTPNVSAGSLSGLVNGDTQAGVTTGSMSFVTTATATSGVGSYAVTGSGLTANNNYTLAQAGGNTTALTISPATLTVTAAAKTMPYGGNALPALTYSFSGLVNGDQISGALTTAATAYNGTAGSGSNAGSYPITQGTVTAGNNYTVSYTGANLTVQPATLRYVAGSATSVYGQTPNVSAGSLSGLVNGDTQAGVTTGSLSFSSAATASTGVGSYAVLGSGLTANGNYTLVQSAGNATALRILPATLTVAADSKSMVYGATALPSLTYTASGLINGDALTGALSTTATVYNGTAGSGSSVGSYPIAQGDLSAGNNYTLSYVGANISVTPAVLTVTGANNTVIYNGQLQTNSGGSYSGQVGSDSFSISGYASGTSSNSAPYVDALTVSPGNNTSLANYSVNYVNGSLEIKPKPATDNLASTLTSSATVIQRQASPTATVSTSTSTIATLTGSAAALDLGGFKVIGATRTGQLQVVFIPNPSLPQITVPVVQLPLTTGLGPLPETVMGQLYLSAGLIPPTTSVNLAPVSNRASDTQLNNSVRVEQTQITTVLANDAPLPTDLTFDPESNTFKLAKGSNLKLPVQVKIQLRQGGSVVSEKLVMLTNEF